MKLNHSSNGAGKRKLNGWIESFLAYTSNIEAAPIWRKWAAISTIAAVLERKVWTRTNKGDLYPNIYAILVGPPGTGKSITIGAAETFLRELEDPTGSTGLHIAPTSMTMASLVDTLAESKRSIVRPGLVPPYIEFNALTILADEFSALIHKYDPEMMAGLTKFWDGGIYGQSRRGGQLRVKIQSTCLNLLAGTTPSSLCKFMPEGAWDQGFASRLIMVYSGDRTLADIFDDGEADLAQQADYRDLLHDLRLISFMYGQMRLTDEALQAFREWRGGGEVPVPDHPKLTHYCSRRTAHLLKLCMVACCSRTNDLAISHRDFEHAKGWLIETELTMPDVFLAGIAGGDSNAIEETWHFIWMQHAKRKALIPEHEIVHFVRERVPSHSVMRTIEIMEREGSIRGKIDVRTGIKMYEPAPRKPGP